MLKIEKDENNFIYSATQKMTTAIVDMQNKETLKAIETYCRENNIIPNLIDKNKLDLILKLGIAEYQRRNLEKSGGLDEITK